MSTGDILSHFPSAGGTTGGAAFDIAVYIMVSMLVLVGIAYLISRVFVNRKLEDWAKQEFLKVFISAAIVGGLVFLMHPQLGVITQAFNSLTPTDDPGAGLISCGADAGLPDGTPLCYAYQYLGMLQLKIFGIMAGIFAVNLVLDIISKIAIDVIIVEVTPLGGLASIVQVLNSALQSLFFLGVFVRVEMALLQFINSTSLNIFLPIGVVLRTFFATRRLGGALIALSVGMYIVFPLAISLNAVSVSEMRTDAFANFTTFVSTIETLDPFTQFTDDPVTGETHSIASPDDWANYIDSFTESKAALDTAVAGLPETLITILSSLLVEIVFLPVLSVILTIIAIKELAALFGSEISLARFEV
ncbi:hypothetical protein KKD40_03675 [Candidatus Micrarchaeota archaeon]|nr:hypothetical protein [Candidatus Micrarchaeota archaeon]